MKAAYLFSALFRDWLSVLIYEFASRSYPDEQAELDPREVFWAVDRPD